MRSIPFSQEFRSAAFVLLLAGCSIPGSGEAAGFAARVAPPRFELAGESGELIREVLNISNADSEVADYVVRTADWDLNADGGVVIHPPELQPDSCRPWTRIERRTLRLPPGGQKRFRFEVQIPSDALDGECRFAILIAPDPESDAFASTGDVRFPVAGQIAVIVYVAVGDAGPKLEFQGLVLREVNGRLVPVAEFRNTGNAHGRPRGLLEGEDGRGQRLDFTVSPLPILPQRTVGISLWPSHPDDPQSFAAFEPPLKLEGEIEWEGGDMDVDVMLGQ